MTTKAEMQAGMHGYITEGRDNGFQNISESTIRLTMSHSNLKAIFPELRVDLHITIGDLKAKANRHCGTGTTFMTMTLRDPTNRHICNMDDDTKMLGFYQPHGTSLDGWICHIVDGDEYSLSKGGGLEDVSLVKKYEISDEDYMKREDNFRHFKAKKLAADPEWTWEKEMHKNDPDWKPREKISDEEFMGEIVAEKGLKVGDRCEVSGGRRGEVAFVGKYVGMLPLGWWVGVKYDEPVGKGDGTATDAEGKVVRYFEADPKYAGFIRPNLLEVGDFPEDDIFASDSEDEI